ncbi:FKBP-type peptidyl-prolyl cis-trans isomerase [Hymenobacter persicinus]|nr:FKBP-type peptidyl-prolyl cis-trans isomerase [Hymenobacter persicinus]
MMMNISTKQFGLTRLVVALLALTSLLSACKKETSTQKAFREHEEAQKIIDDAEIQDYFTRHNINSSKYQRLESGVYLVDADTVANGTGPNVVSGQTVQVKYTGRFIKASREDVIFDQSFGNRTLCQCFEVLVDQSAVIKGWHEAIKNMKLGTRKRVFIPSYMAYGPTGSALIPADEPLMFYMEISKVK